MKKDMSNFNHWRRVNKLKVFTPRSVADIKSGKQKQSPVSSDCGSGCSDGGCSGPGCGVGCGE